MYPNLFSPMKIGKCEIPNRLVVTPMVANLNNPEGLATDRYIKYHEEKAKGGWGLIITEDYAINDHAVVIPISRFYGTKPKSPVIKNDRYHPSIQQQNFLQIYHAGRQSNPRSTAAYSLSCSPIPTLEQSYPAN
jgi:2,4-dienoyl-CoA reductase-like NADH-dependent reductase (Old Yellow Enzyme family)